MAAKGDPSDDGDAQQRMVALFTGGGMQGARGAREVKADMIHN